MLSPQSTLTPPARRPRNMRPAALALVVLLAGGAHVPAQQETQTAAPRQAEAAAAVAEAPVGRELLRRVTADPQFKAALAVIAEQNETVNLSEGRLVTSRRTPGAGEVVFRVTVRGTSEPGEYGKLVYMEQRGGRPLVFFDEERAGERGGAPAAASAAPASPPAPAAMSICLKPWGAWKTTNTYCGFRYLCVFKNQKGMFRTETRSRQCPKGVQTQTRTCAISCGC